MITLIELHLQKVITHIKNGRKKKLHSQESFENVHYIKYKCLTWGKLKYGKTSILTLGENVHVCFDLGAVWSLEADANSGGYNETSPVLISYLSANSGSGGSLCLIASLKSHKAVWHSQDANPSQLGHFWWGKTSRGGKLQLLGGRGEKKSMSNWAVVWWAEMPTPLRRQSWIQIQ